MIGPRKVDKPLILYGLGKLGKLAGEIFDELNIPYDVHDRDTIKNPGDDEYLVAVCVATEQYRGIKKFISNSGHSDIVPIWDIIEAYPEVGLHNGWFSGKCTEEERGNLVYISRRFDRGSQRHHFMFREWRRIQVEHIPPMKFPIIPLSASLPSTLKEIRGRQRVFEYIGRPGGRLDIHCEGCELKTLEVNIELLKKYRPVMSVACYHSRDGLWKIPKFLIDNLDDYEFTFRCHAYMGQAAYIYCTPRERRGK